MAVDNDFFMCHAEAGEGRVCSCASCCGVYNYRGHSRELITAVLARQTEAVAAWDGTDADMERVRWEIERDRPPERFGVIYNCPFAGFVTAARDRVGCLLHPRVRGRELREYCRYGCRTCAEAKCNSYTYLSRDEAAAVAAATGDWYLYGLCITDLDLVRGFVKLCESRLYAPLKAGRISAEPALARAFGDYLALKERWPYARDPGRFGKYWFEGKDYRIYQIDYRKLGAAEPPEDRVLLALGSVIATREELDHAGSLIAGRVDAFLEVYERSERAERTAV